LDPVVHGRENVSIIIEVFPHPPYKQDLVLCHFWLFGTQNKRLERSTFGDPIEVLTAGSIILSTILNIILSTIPLDEFISVFDA
jgi:hypothetical protein